MFYQFYVDRLQIAENSSLIAMGEIGGRNDFNHQGDQRVVGSVSDQHHFFCNLGIGPYGWENVLGSKKLARSDALTAHQTFFQNSSKEDCELGSSNDMMIGLQTGPKQNPKALSTYAHINYGDYYSITLRVFQVTNQIW